MTGFEWSLLVIIAVLLAGLILIDGAYTDLLAEVQAIRAELAAAHGTDNPAPHDRDACPFCRGAGVFDAGLDFETGHHIDMPCGSCAGTGDRTRA